MTRARGHALGSTAATLALSDWERRTAVGGPRAVEEADGWDVDEEPNEEEPMSECPNGPHRPPQGPNEDIAQCHTCWAMTWALRPEGEQHGLHTDDCSLPQRHTGYCAPGGNGHAPAPVVWGYWGPSTEADIAAARQKHERSGV